MMSQSSSNGERLTATLSNEKFRKIAKHVWIGQKMADKKSVCSMKPIISGLKNCPINGKFFSTNYKGESDPLLKKKFSQSEPKFSNDIVESQTRNFKELGHWKYEKECTCKSSKNEENDAIGDQVITQSSKIENPCLPCEYRTGGLRVSKSSPCVRTKSQIGSLKTQSGKSKPILKTVSRKISRGISIISGSVKGRAHENRLSERDLCASTVRLKIFF